MTELSPIKKHIDFPNAPPRMYGREVTIRLTKGKLEFETEMPEEPTAQEIGFLKWLIGEYADQLRQKFPWIGTEQKREVKEIQ